MGQHTVLVADDESRMRKLVRDYLEHEGYKVIEAADGEEAVDIFCSNHGISLVILDIMMPRLDGYEALKEIRAFSSVPVVMLTARSGEKDELKGFALGVDEYLPKPFSPKILVARVNALLRRSAPGGGEDTISCGGITIDGAKRTVSADGLNIDLSAKEYELLLFFLANPGIALSRDKILNSVWNVDYYGDIRTIDTHVKKLRSKLGKRGDQIKTIWGMGYKFEPEDR